MPKNNGELLRLPLRTCSRMYIERLVSMQIDEYIEGPQYHVCDYSSKYTFVRPSVLDTMHISV